MPKDRWLNKSTTRREYNYAEEKLTLRNERVYSQLFTAFSRWAIYQPVTPASPPQSALRPCLVYSSNKQTACMYIYLQNERHALQCLFTPCLTNYKENKYPPLTHVHNSYRLCRWLRVSARLERYSAQKVCGLQAEAWWTALLLYNTKLAVKSAPIPTPSSTRHNTEPGARIITSIITPAGYFIKSN